MLREPRAAVFDLRVLAHTGGAWDERGMDSLPGAPALLESLSGGGIPVAVVASRNASQALPGELREHIDLVLDDQDDDTLDSLGKLERELFLEGARQLGVPAAATAVVANAPAGVRAGIAGGFAVVVGVDRERLGHLDDVGADLVVSGVSDLPAEISAWPERIPDPRPAVDSLDAIIAKLGTAPSIFLDYDGTLTPIVDDPAAATVSERERQILSRLAAVAPVAIISGRGLDDVKQHVGVEGVTYSGSHGFEIEHPDGTRFVQPDAAMAIPELDDAEHALREGVDSLPGVTIERKPYAIAVHVRRARGEEEKAKARDFAVTVGSRHSGLVVRAGKEIFELRPALDWDKGFALAHLLGSLPADTVPMYIGDDETDEDALAEVRRRFGVGVLVGAARGGDTWAGYAVPGTEEALQLLSSMTQVFNR